MIRRLIHLLWQPKCPPGGRCLPVSGGEVGLPRHDHDFCGDPTCRAMWDHCRNRCFTSCNCDKTGAA